MKIFGHPVRSTYLNYPRKIDRLIGTLKEIDGCWYTDRASYCLPDYAIAKFQHVPHRALYILLIDEISDDNNYSMKKCNNKHCCNPFHYSYGTQQDIRRLKSILTDEDRSQITDLYIGGMPISEIGYTIGQSYSTVHNYIVNSKLRQIADVSPDSIAL